MPDRIAPEIHELAYSYRDYEAEVIFAELCWQRYARTSNSRVLDIACGIGEHLRQFALRGYECDGIDKDPQMVEYARAKFANDGLPINVWEADMRNFEMEKKYGLVTNLLASINFLNTNEEVISHLRCVSRALEPGGIYLIEMFHPREYGFPRNITTTAWEIQGEDFYLECDLHYELDPLDPITQTQQSVMRVEISKGDKREVHSLQRRQRVFLLNEFKLMLECAGGFELIKCFGAFNLERPLDSSKRSWRMIPVLRMKKEADV